METPGGEVAEEYSDPLSSESFPFPLVPDQDGRMAMAKFGRPPGVRFNCCRRRYHAAPARYGQYPVLQASSAMTFYPNPRPVPDSIPRPAYVPRNFFTAPWGDHDVPLQPDQVDERIDLGTEEVEAVRKVARMAAEVLKDVGKVVRVRLKLRGDEKTDGPLIAGSDDRSTGPSCSRNDRREKSLSLYPGLLKLSEELYHLGEQRHRS